MVIASDSSVTAASLRERAQPVIAEATRRLVEEFQPEQVWLFGSYAWGEPTEDSDLDLVVVVKESDERPLARDQRAHRCLGQLDMPKDVLVKTRQEFDLYRDVRPSLTYKIVREGRLLHG
ncbi:MAG: nucleotidyltransferase domain-containing protein [Prosthecobacter sp.]|nr:nucleotidyltransferase domain-containing protein [Prosthecobacter sp.]HBJ88247.1 DNA polymerase III subunit beta [Verrucomicrobiales bacterium]